MILSHASLALEPDLPPLRPLLHNRSDAFARGAFVMLPAFDSAWFAQSGGGRQIVIVVTLAAIAIVSLLVAGAAYLKTQHRRSGSSMDDEELFTATPLPMAKEDLARHARTAGHHVFSGLRLPRWVQAGSLIVALVITWVVAQRLDPANNTLQASNGGVKSGSSDRAPEDSPEDLDLSPDSSPAFAFQVRDWVARNGGGCAGLLVVTKGEPNAWSLTARVHDGQGQLIDTARARVSTLRQGAVVEFSFPRADCDRIGAWDVRGVRPSP